VIETERLRLRAFSPGDLDALVEIYGDPETQRFTGGVYTRAQTAARLERLIALPRTQGFGLYAVLEGERLVGRAGFIAQEVEGVAELELAWMFSRAVWGRGYATETAAALRDFWLHQMSQPRLISLIHPDNARSIRVAERIGSRYARDVDFKGQRVKLFQIERAAPGPR
jgi:RimJ/RimL family protein N-acetyltransferase